MRKPMADAVCTCSSVLNIHLRTADRKEKSYFSLFLFFFFSFFFCLGSQKANHGPLEHDSPSLGLTSTWVVAAEHRSLILPRVRPKAAFPAPVRVALPLPGGFACGGGAARSDAVTGCAACRRLCIIRLKPLRPMEFLGRRVPLGSPFRSGREQAARERSCTAFRSL